MGRLRVCPSGGARLQRGPRSCRHTWAKLRQQISERLPSISPVGFSATQPEVAETVSWLKEECGLDDSGAEQMIEYVLQGRAVLGAVPTQTTVIAERFFDEGGGMQLVIHAPFVQTGSTRHGDFRCWKLFCVGFNFELRRQRRPITD